MVTAVKVHSAFGNAFFFVEEMADIVIITENTIAVEEMVNHKVMEVKNNKVIKAVRRTTKSKRLLEKSF